MRQAQQTKHTSGTADQSSLSHRKSIFLTILAALGAGLTASLTSVAIMLLLRLVGGVATPVELFGDHLLKLLPAPRFVDMLVMFSRDRTELSRLTTRTGYASHLVCIAG